MLKPNMLTRRDALKNIGCGFGYLALAGMANKAAAAVTKNPLAAKAPHFKPKAKRVIFIFMQGGPSHVDTFDYKPTLIQRDGEMRDFFDSRKIANSGTKAATQQRIMKPMWDFSLVRAGGGHRIFSPRRPSTPMNFASSSPCRRKVSRMDRPRYFCIRGRRISSAPQWGHGSPTAWVRRTTTCRAL